MQNNNAFQEGIFWRMVKYCRESCLQADSENPFFLYALGVSYPVKIYSRDPSVLILCIIPHITSVFGDHTGSRYRLRLTGTAVQIKLYSLSAVKLQLWLQRFYGIIVFLVMWHTSLILSSLPCYFDFRKHLIGLRKNTGTIIELNLREIACCHSVNAAGHVSGNDFM